MKIITIKIPLVPEYSTIECTSDPNDDFECMTEIIRDWRCMAELSCLALAPR